LPRALYGADVDLSRDELIWTNNALTEVLRGPDAIHGSEFHTRMGGVRIEIEELLARIQDDLECRR
jgi:hypothetical protein